MPPAPVVPTHGVAVSPHSTYSSLVQSDNDLVGLVAYSLYKRDKLKFCESLQQQSSAAPTAAELQTFIHAANMPTRIASYRNDSEKLLTEFGSRLIANAEAELEDDFNRKLLRELKIARPFWKDIGINTLANLGAFAFVALITLIIHGSNIGLTQLFAELTGKQIVETKK